MYTQALSLPHSPSKRLPPRGIVLWPCIILAPDTSKIRSCTCGNPPPLGPSPSSSSLWRTARTEAWPFNLFNGCIVTRPNEQRSGPSGDIRRRQVFMSGPPLPFFPPSVGEAKRERGGEKRRWPVGEAVGSLMKSTIV